MALRVGLLAAGGGFMLWRALEGRRAASTLEGSGAVLASRLALVWALVGVLALVTAATAALSLRPHRRGGTLRLGARAGDGAPVSDGSLPGSSTRPGPPRP